MSPYPILLIGGGVQDPENMEMFEGIINSILRHAPGTPIGLVHLPKDAQEAAAHVLLQN